MEADHIKLKTVGLAVLAILGIETLAVLANSHCPSPILIVGVTRVLEIVLLLSVCRATEPGSIRALGIHPQRIVSGLRRGFLWSAGFGLMAMLAAVILSIAGMRPVQLIAANLPATKAALFSFFLVGGLIGPVAEEVFFRGLLYGYFRRWGMWAALLITSAVFVMAHAVFHRIPLPQIVGGVLFALAYEKEKNLMVPITIHVLGNLAIFSLSLLR